MSKLLIMNTVKVFVNGKRFRKKIIIDENGWHFVRPLKLTGKDEISYSYSYSFTVKEK